MLPATWSRGRATRLIVPARVSPTRVPSETAVGSRALAAEAGKVRVGRTVSRMLQYTNYPNAKGLTISVDVAGMIMVSRPHDLSLATTSGCW